MQQRITKIEAVILTSLILFIIGVSIIQFQVTPHVPIFVCFGLLVCYGIIRRFSWRELEKGIIEGIQHGIIPLIIFILIGVLLSVWIASGTIPTLIAYGFSIVSREFFLITVFVLTAIVGTSIGSAFTTAATLGVAFIGIGTVFGYPLPLIAGAVVSGAFFGDKMSPLSDTTNLASAVAKVDLFEHIRHMMWTTIPAFIVTLIIYAIIGRDLTLSTGSSINTLLIDLQNHTVIHWITLVPMVIVFIAAIFRVPAIPTLLFGIASGLFFVFSFQPDMTIPKMFEIMMNGYKNDTGSNELDSLLNRGGIQSMMWSVSLILLSLAMGGLLTQLGIIQRLLEMVEGFIKNTVGLIGSTAMTAFSINVLLGEQYLSIILTGNVFLEKYEQLGLKRKNLSRTLEDAGTLINPLIPWGVSGVFLSGILGVTTVEYVPYAFFCLLCPLISIILAFSRRGI
ncbi:Na+/H+ antiporter NhaC [Fredinandcohnia humi]